MLLIDQMSREQIAVLRACEERFEVVRQVEDPMPPPQPSVYVKVKNAETEETLVIGSDGTTRTLAGFVPTRLYGSVSESGFGAGVPKQAEKFLM